MARRHFSARVRSEALDVVDAWAAYLSAARNTRSSRADAIEFLALHTAPPAEPGPTQLAVRRAIETLESRRRL